MIDMYGVLKSLFDALLQGEIERYLLLEIVAFLKV